MGPGKRSQPGHRWAMYGRVKGVEPSRHVSESRQRAAVTADKLAGLYHRIQMLSHNRYLVLEPWGSSAEKPASNMPFRAT